jgi:RNA polymerase sigma-70 factor (ECF subfamily)
VTVPARLRVVDGEPAPVRPLAERALDHLDELYSLARHLCGNASDAEDLVQDAYTRALTGRFEEGTNLRAWLFRILRNAFIDHARRRQIVLELPDDTLDPPDPAPDALRYVTGTEVVRAVGELPIELRFVVLLDVEGFSEAEIADIMRTPNGTVKSRLSRAKARLRVLLGGSR